MVIHDMIVLLVRCAISGNQPRLQERYGLLLFPGKIARLHGYNVLLKSIKHTRAEPSLHVSRRGLPRENLLSEDGMKVVFLMLFPRELDFV